MTEVLPPLPNLKSNPDKNNMNWYVLLTAIFIIVTTIVLIYLFLCTYKKLDNNSVHASIYWKKNDSLNLKSGPVWFLYDNKVDSLKSSRLITEDNKKELLELVEEKVAGYEEYKNAINKLAFDTNMSQQHTFILLMYITALCGALGVQLRTISNFVGVACFKNDFIFNIWWPWYLLRPFTGLLIGPILFILFEGKLMPTASQSNYSNVLIISLCILAGFGSEDFLFMLRTLSKRLFGNTDEKSKT